jgi:hypothetical protein
MSRAERLLAVFAGLTLGPLLVYVAYLMLTDIPDKSELITVNTADIVDVKYGHYYRKGRKIPQMCFDTREWDCVIVPEEAAGFKELEHAVEHQIPYSIGFIQTRELFSDSSKRYNMVYAVDVNGRSVKSFDGRVMETRVLWSAVFGLGVVAIGLAIHALRTFLLTES